ncbi:TPR-like protein [Hymenopellis radicata]|nr:TPR-like protein [Hymenopellis radicata]
MSHSHSHAPGENHSHSHGPQPPPQRRMPAPPDPAIQVLIDAQYDPVDLKVDGSIVRCGPHNAVVCKACNLDFCRLTQLATILTQNPNIIVPPPSNIMTNKILSTMVKKIKEEGNSNFKAGQFDQAVIQYTVAANRAQSRAPWELSGVLREEMSTILANRSASFAGCHDYISALADAEAVVEMRKNWPKAYLRKAKALRGLEELEEALDALAIGLSLEPENKELLEFKADIKKFQKTLDETTKA